MTRKSTIPDWLEIPASTFATVLAAADQHGVPYSFTGVGENHNGNFALEGDHHDIGELKIVYLNGEWKTYILTSSVLTAVFGDYYRPED